MSSRACRVVIQALKWLRTRFRSSTDPAASLSVAAESGADTDALPTRDTAVGMQGVEAPLAGVIRSVEDKRPVLVVVTPDERGWLDQIANCASEGGVLLIEGISDCIHPALEPLVFKQLHRVGRHLQVTIGERSVVLHAGFKLFLQVGVAWLLANPYCCPR